MSVYRDSRGRQTTQYYDDDRYDRPYYDLYNDRQNDQMIVRQPRDSVLEDSSSRSVTRVVAPPSGAVVVRGRSASAVARRTDQKFLSDLLDPVGVTAAAAAAVTAAVEVEAGAAEAPLHAARVEVEAGVIVEAEAEVEAGVEAEAGVVAGAGAEAQMAVLIAIPIATAVVIITIIAMDISRKFPAPPSQMRAETNRTKFVRVRVTDISPETLDHFRYPWEWDKDRNFIIIKWSCTREEIDALCRHTREVVLVSKRVTISKPTIKKSTTITTLKPNERRGNLMVARKKSAYF